MPQRKKTEPEAPAGPPKSSVELRRQYLAEHGEEEREAAVRIKALRPAATELTA